MFWGLLGLYRRNYWWSDSNHKYDRKYYYFDNKKDEDTMLVQLEIFPNNIRIRIEDQQQIVQRAHKKVNNSEREDSLADVYPTA